MKEGNKYICQKRKERKLVMGQKRKQTKCKTKYDKLAAKSILLFGMILTVVAGLLLFSSLRDRLILREDIKDDIENKTLEDDDQTLSTSASENIKSTETKEEAVATIDDKTTEFETESIGEIFAEDNTVEDTYQSAEHTTQDESTTEKDTSSDDDHTELASDEVYDEETESASDSYESVDEIVIVMVNLNVRKGPGIDFDIVHTVEEGTVLKRVGIGNEGWDMLIYNDMIVYAKSEYLELKFEE
mgnify:CR=1 FL=1